MELGTYLQFVASLLFVLGLIGVIALLAKRYGLGHGLTIPNKKDARLKVVEARPLDAKRKLVVVRWDDREHLLLIGGSNELHLESKHTDRPLAVRAPGQSAESDDPSSKSSKPIEGAGGMAQTVHE